MPPPPHSTTPALLRLSLTPGLGSTLIARACETLGSAEAVLHANESALRRVKGIGPDRARQIADGLARSEQLAEAELALAAELGISLIGRDDPDFPPLLRQVPAAPPILYIRGRLSPQFLDAYPIAIVGSRSCTPYGLEQAERFSMALAQAGLTIISGGARGIDTSAHRAALRVKGRTVAVLGCGLSDCYPPDNRDLFDQIVASDGAIISELPLATPPNAENFPARNRIISGLSLGVMVIEAGHKSGALITAKIAAEDHGREVFALPSRVDSAASFGSLDLLKSGGAALVTHPDDILAALESPARHAHQGTHDDRYLPFADPEPRTDVEPKLTTPAPRDLTLTPTQTAILAALDEPRSIDDLSRLITLPPATLRSDLTILEIRRRVERKGSLIARRGTP